MISSPRIRCLIGVAVLSYKLFVPDKRKYRPRRAVQNGKTSVIRARCTPEHEARLHEFCKSFGVDISDVIRVATTAYMDLEEQRRETSRLARTIADVRAIDPELADQLRQRVSERLQGPLPGQS